MQKINKIVNQYIFELNVVKFACLLCLLYFVFVHKLFEISLNDNTILVYSKGKKTRRKIKTTINVKKTQKVKIIDKTVARILSNSWANMDVQFLLIMWHPSCHSGQWPKSSKCREVINRDGNRLQQYKQTPSRL